MVIMSVIKEKGSCVLNYEIKRKETIGYISVQSASPFKNTCCIIGPPTFSCHLRKMV
jgi:hypothetical protein